MKINKAHCLVCKCKQDHHCWVNVFKAGIGGTFENKLWNGAHTQGSNSGFCILGGFDITNVS